MSYAIKEIFYTLQGEGANAGRAAVFLRFAGCNLWTGLQEDRNRGPGGCSRWCDTDFVGTDGPGGGRFTSAAEVVEAVQRHWAPARDARQGRKPFVVCTGGEPLLQLDEPLLARFNSEGWLVAVETNGTIDPPAGKLWLTVSPKANAPLRLLEGNELKLVYPQEGAEPERYEGLAFGHFFLQPMDGPNLAQNTARTVEYCLRHPNWRLSLQTHKIVGIP